MLGWVLWPPSGVSRGSLCLRNRKSEIEYVETEAFCPFLLTTWICVLVDSFNFLFPWAHGPLTPSVIRLGTSIILPSVLTLNDYKKSRNLSFLCMATGQGQFSGRFLEKLMHTLLLTLLKTLRGGNETKFFFLFACKKTKFLKVRHSVVTGQRCFCSTVGIFLLLQFWDLASAAQLQYSEKLCLTGTALLKPESCQLLTSHLSTVITQVPWGKIAL